MFGSAVWIPNRRETLVHAAVRMIPTIYGLTLWRQLRPSPTLSPSPSPKLKPNPDQKRLLWKLLLHPRLLHPRALRQPRA